MLRPVLVLLVLLAAVPLSAADPLEKPVGIIVSAAGGVFIDTHQTETQWTAAAGIPLFAGYTLRNVNGSVRFSFCAKDADFILAPGGSITFREQAIEGGAAHLQAAGQPSFCQLPLIARPGGAASRGEPEPPSATPLSAERRAELDARMKPIMDALAAHPDDLNARVARTALLQEFGRAAEAHASAESVAMLAPEATWTRGVKLLTEERQSPRTSIGKTYALLIGISTYKYDPPGSLQYADKDAELFAQLLQAPRGGGLKLPADIRVLTNRDATRAAIDDEVERLARENAASPDSNTLVLFIAGHGAYLPTEEDPVTHKIVHREPYVLTYDSNPQELKTTGYPVDEFRRLIVAQSSHFGRVLVFIDVCHANEIGPITSGRELEPAVRRVFSGQTGEFGMMLATKDLAFESDLFGHGHGAFTYYVVNGWNGGAAPPGGATVEFEDLARFVQDGVRRLTNRKQTPEAIDPDPALLVVPDVKNKPGIQLDPAFPLPPDVTAHYRQGKPTGKATIAESALESQRATDHTPATFEEALAAGVLLPNEERSASRYLDQARGSVPAAQLDHMGERLRVALEDRGQETILRYLEGDQIPQSKDDFLRGAAYFEAALRLAPDSAFDEARMLFCRGRALIFDRAYAQARTLLERSIRLDPARSYAYNGLGIAYLEQIASNASSFDAAIRAFHDAIRFAPYWAYPRHNLALAYTQSGAYADAIRTYRETMPLGPQYSYLPYNLGLLYQQLNEWPLAEVNYRLAKDVAERNPHVVKTPKGDRWSERAEIWDAMGTLEVSRKHWARAENDYRHALQDDSQSLNARHNLALLQSRAGKSKEAENNWRQNLAADPNHLPSLLGYADYLARTGTPDEAMALYARVAQIRPLYGGVYRKMAAIWLQKGTPDQALAELRKAAESSPGNPELLEQMGDLEAQLGNPAAAEAEWRKAADRATDSAARKRLLAKLKRAVSSASPPR